MSFPGVASIRGGWQRTPLRVKLMAAVLMLVAIALLLISVASVTGLNRYLIDQADEDLADKFASANWISISQEGVTGLPESYVVVIGLPNKIEKRAVDTSITDENMPDLSFPDLVAHNDGVPFTVTAPDGKTRWRVRAGTAYINDQPALGALALNLSAADSTVAQLTTINLLVGAAVLAAVAAIGIAMVRASLHPLRDMEATAAAIAAGDLSRRVPQHDVRTEVGQLGAALNTMLSQIETAFAASAASEAQALHSEERMRRFIADASHELRTPLTTVRGFAELYRQRGGSATAEEVASTMRRIEDEAKRMGLLVEDLLLLARLDRERPVQAEPVDLLGIAADAVSAAKVTVPDRPLELRVGKGPLMILGDELRLRQVVSNLLDNALSHTPPDARVEVRVQAEEPYAVLEVADEGPGMTREQAERVFERFYRADPARGRKSGGTGLGLAIVSALVAAHNGRITVDSEVGVGTVFRVRLDLDPAVLGEDGGAPAAPPVNREETGDQGERSLPDNSQDDYSDT